MYFKFKKANLEAALLPEHYNQGIITHALLSSENLKEWIFRYIRYQSLICPFLHIRQGFSGEDVCLHVEPVRSIADNNREIYFLLVHAWLFDLCCWGKIFHDRFSFFKRIDLPFSTPDYRAMRSLGKQMGCEVRFGCEEVRVVISADMMGLPIINSTVSLEEMQSRISERIFGKLEPKSFLVKKIYRIFVGHVGPLPTMEMVADRLCKSVRTLHRHLQREGTSYQQLLINYRIAVAKCYLLETRIPSSEVGKLVGYADSANFYRIFRCAEGITPNQYRKQIYIDGLEDNMPYKIG